MQLSQMRVYSQALIVMGQGWGEVDRHLPTQYKKDNRLMDDGSWNLRRAGLICFNSSGSGSPIMSTALLNSSACSGFPQNSTSFNATVMVDTFRCAQGEDKLELSHGFVVETLSSIHSRPYPAFGISFVLCLFDVGSVIPATSRGLKGEANSELCFILIVELPPLILWFFS